MIMTECLLVTLRLSTDYDGRESVDRYDTLFGGTPLVTRTRDPEHDTARALKAIGYTGKFWTVNAKTGKKRMLVDIDKAAGLTVIESKVTGLRGQGVGAVPGCPFPLSCNAASELF
jgi:hypothetical protein